MRSLNTKQTESLRLTIGSDDDSLTLMQRWLVRQCTKMGIGEEGQGELELVAEEILVNIIEYGLNSRPGSQIQILCWNEADMLWLEFRDHGLPFNVLESSDPNLDVPIDDRPIGGLGIYLVKQFTDAIQYTRYDGLNCLRIGKRCLASDTLPSQFE